MITLNLVMHVKIGGLVTQSLAKLIISLLEEPFMKWGLDFVGPIKQAKRYMLPQTMLLNGWKQEH